MLNTAETRRAGLRRVPNALSLGSDKAEYEASDLISQQANWIALHHCVSAVVAKVIAEHAFNRRQQR